MRRCLLRQRKQEMKTPRRLPNFPAPPANFCDLRVRCGYDWVSNPNEDGMHVEQRTAFLSMDPVDFNLGPPSASTPGCRPLPPLPHYRDPSAHLIAHALEAAHSRSDSGQAPIEQYIIPLAPPSAALNPHAKPFMFGSSGGSSPWGSLDAAAPPPPLALGHAHLPSSGKLLNAAALFKPTVFTFHPPPGVPQLTFPVSPASRSLPTPPATSSPACAQQGREMRQRRGSHITWTTSDDRSNDNGIDKVNMAAFRFPSGGPLCPLTFSGFPSDLMYHIEEPAEMELEKEDLPDSDPEEKDNNEQYIPIVVVTKLKHAPIPLDFKNPTSINTVPVFKALIGDEKTRQTVRSQLGLREIFDHSQRPSLDDFAMPAISMSTNRSRSHFVTDPGLKHESIDSLDIFTPAIKRRSSLPTMHSAHNSSLSNVSIPAINLTKRLKVLDEKF